MTETLVVAPADAGLRIDRLLALRWPGGATRGQIQRWIDEGHVLLDGRPTRSSQKVVAGARIDVTPPPPLPTEARPDASVRFPVLFEDEWLIVLDKPAGLVVHPARGHADGTLVNGLLALDGFAIDDPDADSESFARPGIVHRLDKDTSGVMVVARHERAREGLKALFEHHDLERSYLAITVGDTPSGTIATLHGRHPTDRIRFSTHVASGKRAVTHVEALERIGGCSLVRCRLETGRTHQIRVHLTEATHTPLLGDPLYGRPPRDPFLRDLGNQLARQALHAAVLGFVHPITGASLRFETPPPDDFARALAALRAR